MTATPERSPEVLVLEGRPGSMESLARGLRTAGLLVDITHDVQEVRDAFFRRGGHDLIVLGHDLPDGIALAAAQTVAAVDRSVRILAFGDRLPETLRATRLSSFHPGSRAAVGAVLRHTLPIPDGEA